MSLERWLQLIKTRLDSTTRAKRILIGCWIALALISGLDAIILAVRCGEDRKTGPNLILSPWDVSKAPPQCIRRSMVRIVGSPQGLSAFHSSLDRAKGAKADNTEKIRVAHRPMFAPFDVPHTE